jgi:hypothetical protein
MPVRAGAELRVVGCEAGLGTARRGDGEGEEVLRGGDDMGKEFERQGI